MKKQIHLDWVEKMEFRADIDGHKVTIDAPAENGGNDNGARPKPFMMVALAGCTGMDVVSILKKMKVDVKGLSITVEGDMEEEPPKAFTSMHVLYTFKGSNLPMDKLEKAVKLSEEKYCGVSAVLKKALNLTYEIKVEEA
ncbi:MAG: OsmC family protein [bacterium]